MTTATPKGAQAHAPRRPTSSWRRCLLFPATTAIDLPAGVNGEELTWAETVAGGNWHVGDPSARRHPAPRRPHRGCVCARAPLQRPPDCRTAQCRGHDQGAAAGIPQPLAPSSSPTSAGHWPPSSPLPPTCTTPCVAPRLRRPTSSATETAHCRVRAPLAASCSSWPRPNTASRLVTSRPACPSFKASEPTPTGGFASPGRLDRVAIRN